jgi:hypothetical protein
MEGLLFTVGFEYDLILSKRKLKIWIDSKL